jgi:DHA2 family multidrug resistance protein
VGVTAEAAGGAVVQRFGFPDVTPRPQPGLRGVAIVTSAIFAILVDQTSTAIINTGLPYLQGITAASPDDASWIITAFNATYYAFILLSPWMMGRVGRTRLMVGAFIGFSLTSFVLAATSDYHVFIVLRTIQGAFLGCIFVPAALLLFTSLPLRALKFAPPGFVLVSLSGGTLGTVIGGFFADEYGGSSVFIPGAVATLVTAVLIAVAVNAPDRPQPDLRFDATGVALSIATFAAMQFLANEGERRNWFDDSAIVRAAVLLAVVLPLFVVYELFVTRDPHVDFRMFVRHRNLSVGAIINIGIGAVGYSVTVFVGYLQAALGATPTLAGALVLVRLATYAFGVPAAFYLIAQLGFDIRAVVILGVLGSAAGLWAFSNSMTTTADFDAFVGISLVFGFFFGMMNQPMGALVIGSMPLPLLAAGVSIYKLSSPVGLMIATGGMQTLLDHSFAAFHSAIAGNLALARAPVNRYVQMHHGNAASLAGIASSQAQTLAYASVMLTFAFIVLIVVPIIFLAKVQKPATPAANV